MNTAKSLNVNPSPSVPDNRKKCIYIKPRSVGISIGVAEHLRTQGFCVHENWTDVSQVQKIFGEK